MVIILAVRVDTPNSAKVASRQGRPLAAVDELVEHLRPSLLGERPTVGRGNLGQQVELSLLLNLSRISRMFCSVKEVIFRIVWLVVVKAIDQMIIDMTKVTQHVCGEVTTLAAKCLIGFRFTKIKRRKAPFLFASYLRCRSSWCSAGLIWPGTILLSEVTRGKRLYCTPQHEPRTSYTRSLVKDTTFS